MATQAEMLAELKALNAELGLSENDGIQSSYEQSLQELRKLDEELASTPESFEEYVTRRKQEDSRSLGEKTSAFTDSFITGASVLAEEGGRAIKQLVAGDVGLKEVKGVFQVGVKDFGRFAKTLGGAAMDNFYSDENEMKREYERYKDNFLYNQNVRTAMLDTFDEKGRDFVSFGANFIDPTMFIPIAGQVSKAASVGLKSARLGKVAKAIEKGGAIASKPTELIAKGTRKAIEKTAQAGSKIAGATGKAGEVTAKAAAFPRNFVTNLASKTIDPKVAGSGILGAQVTGAFTGAVPGLGLLTSAEVAGYIANKSGRGMERVLTALGSEAGQKRFLQRLAMQADSPTTRKLALYAHKLGGTRMGDMAFNSLVNGISVSTLNGALAYASTDNIEELGQAMGAGFAMGGALPVGQPGMRAGRSQAARDQSSVNFLEAKLGQEQLKQFRKMDPDARLAFATVEEAGIKAPKLMFVDKDLMLKTLREDDPNIRQAPNAYFDQNDNTIYVNENGRASKSSKEAFDILTHELGHGFITQAIKDDPFFARKILAQYEAKPGEKAFEFAFTTDSAGAPIDSIMLNEDAKKIASAYDSIQEGDKSIGIGQDANLLAQEIGAEQFAMMMVDNPNYFNTIEPSLRQKLLEGSRKVLTLFGAVDGNTGNPLDVSISPILKRNKSIRNLYKNYTKQRDASIADKVDLAEKGVAMKVRKGESADQAVERLYGKQGISLKEAGAFRIDNKKVKNELTNILNRLDEAPEGGMSSERNPRSGRPQAIVGKQLSDEVKGVFTRKDPRGTINMLINDITESIRNRLQLNFLYRSGKPSKYSDNELKARVVSPVRFKVTGLSKTSRSAASLKMDAIDEAYLRNNVEVLVKEGFADNPNDLIELARKVAREALDDEEGRINPQGNYENELVTAVFGQPESAPQIRNAKLRQLLEDKKLQHAYRSYDVDALAGLVPTGKSGIAFDWFNIKNNYSPFDDKLFIPKPEADVQITDKLFMPASEAGAGKGTSALDILKSNQKPEGLPKVPTILEIAEYFKKEFGNPIDYKKSTPEQNRLFEDLIYEEVLYAQELHPEAAGWYDENLSLALSVLEELDPTIKQPDNNFIFKSVLAATSDGNKVQPQFDQTWATYNHWKDTGEISGKFVGGDRISNIKNNLLRIEAIFQLMGGEGAGRWLSQKGTIGEIRKAAQEDLGYTKAEASKIGTSELVDEVVPYAVILGPKLGSFFNNLYGDYSTFTMDRWFMRTVGRNTGTQVVPIPPAKLNAAKQRVRDAVNSLTPAERKKIGITKQSVAGNNAIKASTKLAGYFTKKQNRTGVSAEVDNLRRAANALNKFGKPLKEAPQNGAERRWLRERLETVQSRLRDVGVNLENADLQALLWYNEKEIYEKLGYRSPTGSADYAGAAEALHARKAGKPSRSYAEGTGRVGEIGRSTGESVLGKTSPQEVNFLPAGNFSRQPANRITRQAPAMPGNRFMLPAATAGAKSAERFR